MNLESLLLDPWPDEIRKATDSFHQGHLIEDVPLFYLAAPSTPATTFTQENSGAASKDLSAFALPKSHRYKYCAVTSATCDLAEAGKPKNPFFQVAPAFDASTSYSEHQWNSIKEGKFTDFVYLTQQPIPDGLWVVDLRVSLPLEKAILCGRQPINGFATERDRINFAQRLAARSQRPALSEHVHDNVVASIADWFSSEEKVALREDSGRFADVERVCLRIGGDRLDPEWVQVFVFQETNLSFQDKGHWRRWRNRAARSLKKLNIKLEPVAFNSLTKMTVEQYEGLVPLFIPGLGRRSGR